MQQVIWCVQYKDGSKVVEVEPSGKENSFVKCLERKNDMAFIGMIDTVNNLKYVIDLKTGEFIMNGLALSLSKNIDGRNFYFTNLPNKNYADGVIHYKCSQVMESFSAPVKAATYNIGYKIPWDFQYQVRDNDGGDVLNVFITHVQPMITVDALNLKVGVSILMTSKAVDKNGNERYCKL